MNATFETQAESGSGRKALLFLIGSAVYWLVAGSFFLLLAGVKLLCPQFLDGCSVFTFGRLVPVAACVLIYGWASLAGLACALFLLSRLGGSPFQGSTLFFVATLFWNLALFVGLCAILAGAMDWAFLLGLPSFALLAIFGCYLILALPGYRLFHLRVRREMFASTWYLLAALLLFPALCATGGLLLIADPVPGSAQGPVEVWFGGGLFNLWLAPLALGCLYFLVPQITGRRLPSYNLSLLAFRCFILFGAWAGLAQLIGGPVPAWLVSSGAVASLLLCIPVLIIALNLFGALHGEQSLWWTSIPLRFALPGVAAFLIFYVEGFFLALPAVSGIFQFSDVVIGLNALAVGGFFSMSFFAAIYYFVPRLLNRRLADSRLISWHYWLSVLGIGAVYLLLTLGGLLQGFALTDVNSTFSAALFFAAPFRWLALGGVAAFFLGACSFAFWFLRLLLQPSTERVGP